MPLAVALPNRGPPAAGQVQVWRLHLRQLAGHRRECEALLDATERNRAARFYFEPDRESHVLAHGVLRHLLAGALGSAPAALVFAVGAQGKPALATSGPIDLRFNLSHAGEWLFIALARGAEVGIDVEQQRAGLVDELLPSLAFTAPEKAWITGHDGAARTTAFFEAWSRKEAAIKAWGMGLSLALDRFDVTPTGGGPCVVRPPPGLAVSDRAWTLQDLPAPAGHSAALVSEGGPPALVWFGHAAVCSGASKTRGP
jgi:4'-phosphopantetheinyl transferase